MFNEKGRLTIFFVSLLFLLHLHTRQMLSIDEPRSTIHIHIRWYMGTKWFLHQHSLDLDSWHSLPSSECVGGRPLHDNRLTRRHTFALKATNTNAIGNDTWIWRFWRGWTATGSWLDDQGKEGFEEVCEWYHADSLLVLGTFAVHDTCWTVGLLYWNAMAL